MTYLALLLAVALLGVGLAVTGETWSLVRQRDKERQLLAVGNEIREAIKAYYENTPGGVKQYPRRLEDLVKDDRFPGVRRYLRRIYPDPMTNEPNWGLLKTPQGTIMGVHSQSIDKPIKSADFERGNDGFDAAKNYTEWKFVALGASPESAVSNRPATAH